MALSLILSSTRGGDEGVLAAARGPPGGKNVSPWVKVIAGMAAGVTEAVCLQPLDVAKTRLQLDKSSKYKGTVHCVRTIAAEEGPRALYKGLTPFVTHLTIKYALRFGIFGLFQRAVGTAGPEKREFSKTEEGIRNWVAGLGAGVAEALAIVTPFEVVKTRLQQQEGLKNLRYKGPVHTALTVVREEGPLALWKGAVPTCIRQGSNQAFNFAAYHLIDRYVWGKEEGDGVQQALWKPFVTGLFSAMLGPICNCPMDVIKTRLMAQDTKPGETPRYAGVVDTIRKVSAEEGPRALWKGLIPRLARVAPGQAITWTVVSNVQVLFEQRNIAAAEEAEG